MQSTGFAAEVFTCILIPVRVRVEGGGGTVEAFTAAGHGGVLRCVLADPFPKTKHTHIIFISAQSYLVHYLVTAAIDTPR